MPRNRKYFPNKAVLFVTTRTQDSLPIVCAHHMNFIIWGILAKARTMFSVKVCHFVFMPNHLHMLLVVDCPQELPDFMGYVKGEISHAINRLVGRRQKTIWNASYDSPILLTTEDVKRYIKYIYQNPTKANLVERIEDYPGVSSWEMFSQGDRVKKCLKLSRNLIPKLSSNLGINEQKRLVDRLNQLQLPEYEFTLEPDAWKDSFEGSEISNQEIIQEIKEYEDSLIKERRIKKIYVIGQTALRRESMTKEYTPKKFSKKMICICSDLSLRKVFIETFKHLSAVAKNVFEKWKKGEFGVFIPAGMFSPRIPERLSALSIY